MTPKRELPFLKLLLSSNLQSPTFSSTLEISLLPAIAATRNRLRKERARVDASGVAANFDIRNSIARN